MIKLSTSYTDHGCNALGDLPRHGFEIFMVFLFFWPVGYVLVMPENRLDIYPNDFPPKKSEGFFFAEFRRHRDLPPIFFYLPNSFIIYFETPFRR